MGLCVVAPEAHTLEQRAPRDAGGCEEGVVRVDEVTGGEDLGEIEVLTTRMPDFPNV